MGSFRRHVVFAFVSTFLTFSVGGLASDVAHLQIDCNASPDRNDGYLPPFPTVKLHSVLTERLAKPGEFVCNDAVNSPVNQAKFIITSAETLIQLQEKLGGNHYFAFTTKPQSLFGACDLRPVRGATDDLKFGDISVSNSDAVCTPGRNCGPFGLINPSDPQNQIANAYFDFNYQVDASGKVQLVQNEWYPHYVSIEFIPVGGDHYPFDLDYKLNSCTITTK